MFFRYFYIVILLFFLPKIAFGQNNSKPRSLSTERPSKSDSIYTLNQGKFLFETSLLSKTLIRNSSQKIKSTSLFDFSTFRYGINHQNEIITLLKQQLNNSEKENLFLQNQLKNAIILKVKAD